MSSHNTSPLPVVSDTSLIHVAVVEDNVACRIALEQAIENAPDMRLSWSAGGCKEALAHLLGNKKKTPLDVLLVDLGLPDGSGIDVIGECRSHSPHTAPMVSTIFGDEDHVLRAIQAGAMGYLLKDLVATEVLDELRSLHAGGSPINPMVARKLLMLQTPKNRSGPGDPFLDQESLEKNIVLSSRETEVLRLVSRGYTLDEVGLAIGVSRHTVRTFVRRMYAKLQVSTRAEAVNKAISKGLLDKDAHDA